MPTLCVKDPGDVIPIINAVIRCTERKARAGRVGSLHPDVCEALVSRPYGRAFQYGRVLGNRIRTCVFVQWCRWNGLVHVNYSVFRAKYYVRSEDCVHVDGNKWLAMMTVSRKIYEYRRLVLSRYFRRRLERMGIPVPDSNGCILWVIVPQTVGARRVVAVSSCELERMDVRIDLIFDCGLRVCVKDCLSKGSASFTMHAYGHPRSPRWGDITGMAEWLSPEPVDVNELHDMVKARRGTLGLCRCDEGHVSSRGEGVYV